MSYGGGYSGSRGGGGGYGGGGYSNGYDKDSSRYMDRYAASRDYGSSYSNGYDNLGLESPIFELPNISLFSNLCLIPALHSILESSGMNIANVKL